MDMCHDSIKKTHVCYNVALERVDGGVQSTTTPAGTDYSTVAGYLGHR